MNKSSRPMTAMGGILLCLLVAVPNAGHAQEHAFPYALDSRDWVIAPVGFASAALGIYLVGQTEAITLAEITALDRQNVNGFDRGATHNWSPTWQDRSDWTRNIVVLGSALLSGAPWLLDGQWSNTVTLGTMLVEAAALTAGVTYIAKGLAGRARPYVYNTSLTPEERYILTGPGDASVHQSFFSGHASSAFAAATLLSTMYTDLYGSSTASKIVWSSSLSLAALTGYARVKGGVHFPSDVFVGAAVGAAIGYLVPALHRVDADHPMSISAGLGGVQLRLAVGGR